MGTTELCFSSVRKPTYVRGHVCIFKHHLYIKEFSLSENMNIQRYMYYVMPFHKKHHIFTYQIGMVGNNSETIWMTRLQYNVRNIIKMWIYSKNQKVIKAPVEVQVWNASQII